MEALEILALDHEPGGGAGIVLHFYEEHAPALFHQVGGSGALLDLDPHLGIDVHAEEAADIERLLKAKGVLLL